MFNEWLLSSDVDLLVRKFARRGVLGSLGWKYTDDLPDDGFGKYVPSDKLLLVNKKSTGSLFNEQILTVLHEIQHWNQHVSSAEKHSARGAKDPASIYEKSYSIAVQKFGRGNQYEKDAEQFARANFNDALAMLNRQNRLDAVVDELADRASVHGGVIQRSAVKIALRRNRLQTHDGLESAIQRLNSLGIVVEA